MPSSVIKFLSYSKPKQVLTVGFVTGLVYHYLGVPEQTFKLFKASLSKGKFFNYHIKDKFAFEQKE